MCLGDSITGNYDRDKDYPWFIKSDYGINAYNCGFGGNRMSLHADTPAKQPFSFCSIADSIASGDWSSQYENAPSTTIDNVYEHIANLENMDWSKVDYMTVMYGTNDWHGSVPLDNDQNLYDVTTFLGAFRHGVETILEAYPNVKIMAIAPMYRHLEGTDDSDNKQYGGKYLWEFGDALGEVCKTYHIPFYDAYRLSGVNAIDWEYYIADGTHPTLEGRKNLGSKIGGQICAVM